MGRFTVWAGPFCFSAGIALRDLEMLSFLVTKPPIIAKAACCAQ